MNINPCNRASQFCLRALATSAQAALVISAIRSLRLHRCRQAALDSKIGKIRIVWEYIGRLCGLVVRVLGYRSRGPGSIPGTTRFSEEKTEKKRVVGLERGTLSLVSTTEELLDGKEAAPV
jgi:hypothetical protein